MGENLEFITLNVRGIQTLAKRRDYLEWLIRYNNNIIFLQETHTCALDENNFRNIWGQGIHYSHGTTRSRGVMTIIPKAFINECKLHYRDLEGRILINELKIKDNIYYLINIYAPSTNSELDKTNFLIKLQNQLTPLKDSNLILGGDWNLVLDPTIDKKGGSNIDKFKKSRQFLKDLMEEHDLSDCWRLHHPNKKQFTWRQKNPKTFCRLDMWLISSNLLNIISFCKIDLGFKSDHSSVTLSFKLSNFIRGKGIWKFNNSLLHDLEYVNLIKRTITQESISFNEIEDKGLAWDYMKMMIRSDTMFYSGAKNKEKKSHITKLENRLRLLEFKLTTIDDENIQLEIDTINTELEQINNEKTRASIFRSKCDWSEFGEKNSKFFLNLEKHNYLNKTISKLEVNNNEIVNEKEINENIKEYYQQLYSKIECNTQLLDDVIIDLPMLSENDKLTTNGIITESEALKSLKTLSNGKTPGIDGLTTDFYKFFWNNIKTLVLQSLNFSFNKGEMSKDQKLGIITLTPKKNKIRLHLKNWRPITLLTVDYKILAKCLAIRLEDILPKYISQSQFGYVKDRYIGENIRCVIDINEICKENNIQGLALQIDFEKAFDSISWDYMFKTLEKMNFGEDFIKWVKILYKNTQSKVLNNGTLTDSFDLQRGVHQGCPLSALLFILLVQVLEHMLNKREDINGLKIGTKNISLLQMADDTTIFTNNHQDVGKILRLLKAFSKISGLKINVEKTIAYVLGPMLPPEKGQKDFGLKWNTLPINLLGISITNDENRSIQDNFAKKVDSINILTKLWSTRNLSMKGKLTIIKSILIPKLVYPCTILITPPEIIKQVDNIITKFLWNWKQPKIKKDVIIRTIDKGGLKTPCLECKIEAWKSKWAIRCLKNNELDPLWVYLVNFTLPNELNLKYLLNSRPTEKCLKDHCDKLSKFYKEIILTWTKIKDKHIPTTKEQIRNECIWLNKNISLNKKTLYSKKCMEQGLMHIKDLLTTENIMKDLITINNEYNVKWNFLDHLKIRQAIPSKWKNILANHQIEDKTTDILYKKFLRYKTLKSTDCYWQLLNNKHDLDTIPNSLTYWQNKYNINTTMLINLIKLPYKCIRDTRTQTLQYKLTHKILNTNSWLHKIKIIDSPKCRFCKLDETIEHFMFQCNKTKEFWKYVTNWWNKLNLFEIDELLEKDIILGVANETMNGLTLNTIILIGKASVQNNKMNNKQPDTYTFLCQLKFYLRIEEEIHIKNKTIDTFLEKWENIMFNI
jgi:exonuclease III